jgi:hypothetical protein
MRVPMRDPSARTNRANRMCGQTRGPNAGPDGRTERERRHVSGRARPHAAAPPPGRSQSRPSRIVSLHPPLPPSTVTNRLTAPTAAATDHHESSHRPPTLRRRPSRIVSPTRDTRSPPSRIVSGVRASGWWPGVVLRRIATARRTGPTGSETIRERSSRPTGGRTERRGPQRRTERRDPSAGPSAGQQRRTRPSGRTGIRIERPARGRSRRGKVDCHTRRVPFES